MLLKLTVRRSCMIVFLLFLVTSTFAQKMLSGKVTNTQNQPVAGASVHVKGSNITTQTDPEGSFSIRVPGGSSVLEISFVGFEPFEISVDDSRASVAVTLKESASTLSDVVVTGYSSQSKKDITGSVAVVNVKD